YERVAWLAVLVQAYSDVAFVPGDFEFVRQWCACVRHAMPHWLIELSPEHRQFLFQFGNAACKCVVGISEDGVSAPGHSAHVLCLAGVQRRGALRAFAIDRD